ncbi:hypothetical protein [Dictyobacter formicarum]|uniref:Uncharacterized protein n=1 Tax=Dictyobacter formicarum TaxID=2778368 RepID=A0ABQ3VT52_9CHLR|nr:hypothetical protein [Dictyobacter formicarum]GHO88879.1 hypothetical protein KSZ_68850 [Dictyobacter formicarum]
MQSHDKDNDSEKNQQIPTAVAKYMGNASIAVRFEAIGDRSRFRVLLQHFRFQFVLARCEEIDNLKWWLITESQFKIFTDFCSNHGLRLITA